MANMYAKMPSIFDRQLQAAFQPQDHTDAVNKVKAALDLYALRGEEHLRAVLDELREEGFDDEGISTVLQQASSRSNYMNSKWVQGQIETKGLDLHKMATVHRRRRRY